MAEISDADVQLDAPATPAAQPQAPSPEISDSDVILDKQRFGGAKQTALAGLEGAARGVMTAPLANAIEKGWLHVNPEEIRGRQEQHPIASGAGEAAGLIGGALTGTGEAAALEAVGKSAAEAAGLGAAKTYTAKVGSSVVKNAAEMAAYQSQDEVGKMILQDPNAGAQSAISNIGLAAALGGVGGGLITGVASPLWNATVGSKLGAGLKAMVSRIGGIEGEEVGTKAFDLEQKAGVLIPDEIKATINDLPGAREAHSILSQDDSSIAGRAYQKKLQELDANIGTKIAESLGRTPDDIMNVAEKNAYESGQNMGNVLHDELEKVVKPINEAYDTTIEKFKASPVSEGAMRTMADELSQKSIQEGWAKSFDDENNKLVGKILEKLPEQTTIADLKNAITNLYRPFDAADFRAAVEAKKILSRGLETAVSEHMGPEELTAYNQLKQRYAQLSSHLEDLDAHLHVGKWIGPKTFLDALKDKANTKGEQLLSNLTSKNNANLLSLLENHPNTLQAVTEHYKNELLRSSTKNVAPGELIKTSKLLREIENLSPQQKALIATPEQHQAIEAAHAIKDALKDPTHNFSNTARTLRKHMAGAVSPISLIAMAMGHGEAGIMSFLGSLGLNEARPAMKLGLLKMLGSSAPVDAAGFKAAAEYLGAAQKGAKLLSTASENVFRPGFRVLATTQMPTHEEIKALDKLVSSNDPKTTNKVMASAESGHVGHYMPEHQTALTQSSLQALQYLKGIKQAPQQIAPLDRPLPPTPAQEARYQRALEIAQQPAIVLQHIKDGTIQTTDLQDLNGMYPALYQQLGQKLTNDMMTAKDNGVIIPYKTRVGLSLFLGQSLDTSMQPASILAAQPQPKVPPAPQGAKIGKRGTSTLGKSNASYKTPNQAAESDRGNRD